MTTPVAPSKAKTWVGLAGSLLAVVVPLALEVSDSLPAPWPAVIGAVVAVLTAVGIYKAPYVPSGTVVAPVEEVARPHDHIIQNPRTGQISESPHTGYTNPWK